MGNCITLKKQLVSCCGEIDVHNPVKIKQMSIREIIDSRSVSRIEEDGLPPAPEKQQLLEKDEVIEEPADTTKVIFTISDGESDEFGLNYDSDFSVDSDEFSEIELGNM